VEKYTKAALRFAAVSIEINSGIARFPATAQLSCHFFFTDRLVKYPTTPQTRFATLPCEFNVKMSVFEYVYYTLQESIANVQMLVN